MDVAVSVFRSNLSEWLKQIRDGEEVVLTERGVPVARVVGIGTSSLLERLTAEGVIGRPASAGKPSASGRSRPRPRRPVASRVGEQRR